MSNFPEFLKIAGKFFCNYSANINVLIPKEYARAYFIFVIPVTRADTQVRPYG
jgi:hypothetical protein